MCATAQHRNRKRNEKRRVDGGSVAIPRLFFLILETGLEGWDGGEGETPLALWFLVPCEAMSTYEAYSAGDHT
jgi:hypothetical protein